MILVAEFHRLSSVGEDIHTLCRECDTVLGAVLGHAEQIVKHAVDTIYTQRRAGSQVADNDSITVISNDKPASATSSSFVMSSTPSGMVVMSFLYKNTSTALFR